MNNPRIPGQPWDRCSHQGAGVHAEETPRLSPQVLPRLRIGKQDKPVKTEKKDKKVARREWLLISET